MSELENSARARIRAVVRPSAEHDPTGTIRRVITNWGFAHYIKLSQPSGAPCWMCYDCYGPTDDILPQDSFLTDLQLDARNNTEVVYVPMDDDTWARIHGLDPHPAIDDEDNIA
jgi:hypothetical protein